MTFELTHGNMRTKFQVTVGYFPDSGKPAEIFITGAKSGSEVDAVTRDGAIAVSLALQHGVPLETLRHAITRNEDGTPSTIVGAVIDKLATD